MKIKIIIVLIALCSLTACGGGGGGGGGGTDTISITGTVSTATGQQAALAKRDGFFAYLSSLIIRIASAFSSSPLNGAHVNVCTIQNGSLEPLPAHPTVLADSSGSFVISVDKNDIPANRQMWVCAAPPASDNYTVLAPIPEDLLPQDLTEVTTVSVNPDVNTTLITRYACGQNILFFNSSKCLQTDQAQLQVLNDGLDGYFNSNPGVTPDLRDLTTLLSNIANDSEMRTIFEAWLAEVTGVSYNDFVTDAQNFVNPTIPDPSGGEGTVSIGAFTCDYSAGEAGSTRVTIAASGSGGGGSIDVITIFFRLDGGDLTSPDTLVCTPWSQTGGLGTCSKGASTSDTMSYVATYSFDTFSPPSQATVEVKGFASGSPTVLDSAEQTVTCQ